MKVNELIDALKECNPEAIVCVWVDGERYPLHQRMPLDQWEDDKAVDINVSLD